MIHQGFLSACPDSARVCENLYLGKKDIAQAPERLENGSDAPLSPVGLK